jgi:hypothetical protein
MVGAVRLLSFAGLCATVAFAAPDSPVYSYAGKPITLPVNCTYERVQNLGLACSEAEPCRVFLELTDVEQVAARLFLTGNLHTDSTTIESVLLLSEDDGKTWAEPASRIPLAGLDRIEFIDFESGWISGQVQHIAPKDPFFLITRDGGKNWRRQLVWGDARPGAVEKFHFQSRTNGAMLIDRVQPDDNGMRHMLYETSTGGDSWSIREISPTPLAWKYPDLPDKEMRLRTDAATKSYRVERRQGGRWELLAAFHISANECKPPDPVASETAAPAEPSAEEKTPEKPAYDRPIAPRRPPTLKK